MRYAMKITKTNGQAGESLVGLLVSVGIMAVMGMGMAKVTSNGMNAKTSSERKLEIEELKRQLSDSLDCEKTLSVTSATMLPLACTGAPVILKRANGHDVFQPDLAGNRKLGKWTVTAKCVGTELVVKAARSGNDPLTKKAYTATDAFNGKGRLCSKYFTNASLGAYGGGYRHFLADGGVETSECLEKNPKIGACGCPPGYQGRQESEFKANYDSGADTCDFFFKNPYTLQQGGTGRCGYVSRICVKS